MPKEIIIIGGGIAGLSAANELRDCRVTLLEARDRFGGRIFTQRTASEVVELGAEFIHGRNQALLESIRAARLKIHPASKRYQYFDNGKLVLTEIWKTFGAFVERIDPHQRDQSFYDFLHQQAIDEQTRRRLLAFAEGFNAAHAGRLSAHSLRFAGYCADQMNGDEQSRIHEGYSALVDFFVGTAKKAGSILRTETIVRSVNWKRGRVEVEAVCKGESKTFSGEAAIITLPLGVLKAREVTFHPGLSAKEEAVAGLEFGNAVKIILTFAEVWWPERDFGFINALDEPLPTWWSDSRHSTLTGWAGGPKADALVSASAAQLESLALETLARIFSSSVEKVRAKVISIHQHNWAGDPFTRGAYSYIPVNGLFLPKQLGAPVEDTLFFAGEATARDAQTGTVFAALESGLRVAREIQAT